MFYATLGAAAFDTKVTERVDNRQILNSDGGYVYPVTDQARLERFLILGADKPSYYLSAEKLTLDNAKHLKQMIDADGLNVVLTIVDIATNARAPKQDAGIFALAVCACLGDEKTREAARLAVPQVCRYHSVFLQFLANVGMFRNGFGRGMRGMIQNWYGDKPVPKLAYDLVKYRERRYGKRVLNARNVFRMAHPMYGFDESRADHYKLREWAVKGTFPEDYGDGLDVLQWYEIAHIKNAERHASRSQIASHLTHEMIPDDWKDDPAVWDALLHAGNGMPPWALIRNLAKMTRVGLLTPRSDATRFVVQKLASTELLRKGMVHPAKILTALGAYRSGGEGGRGGNMHIPVPQIVDALDTAFYLCFPNLVPAGKRTEIGLDVSGSMNAASAAQGLTSMEAAAAIALVTVNSEPQVSVFGFSTTYTPLPIVAGQRIADVTKYIGRLPFEATEAALPMVDALAKRRPVDTFVILTDNEVNRGRHPMEALRDYRRQMGIPAKLVVFSMQAVEFSIADPNDAGTMDISGFDSFGPRLLADVSRGTPAAQSTVDDQD